MPAAPRRQGSSTPQPRARGPPFPESCVGHVGSSSEDCVYQGVAWMVRMAQPRPQLTCVLTPTGTGVLLDSFSLVIQETRFQALKLAWGKRPSRFRLAAKKKFIEFLFTLGLWAHGSGDVANPCSSAPCWGNSEFTGPGPGRRPGTSLRPNMSTVVSPVLNGSCASSPRSGSQEPRLSSEIMR